MSNGFPTGHDGFSFEPLFLASASKTVSKTDKSKAALVLTQDQVRVLSAAGLVLGPRGPTVLVQVLGEPTSELEASYYYSTRKALGREPEPRMGRAFISEWLEEGDVVTLATDGDSLFAYRTHAAPPSGIQYVDALARVNSKRLHERVAAAGQVQRRDVVRSEFIRSPAVVELVLRRANGTCEYPECSVSLFAADGGRPYLEVHHIQWLSEGGPDTPENAAALCPVCHRAQHFATDRGQRRATLRAAIDHRLGKGTSGSQRP
jgi:5-methylcytosine-specific restriction endonuclease McrA